MAGTVLGGSAVVRVVSARVPYALSRLAGLPPRPFALVLEIVIEHSRINTDGLRTFEHHRGAPRLFLCLEVHGHAPCASLG